MNTTEIAAEKDYFLKNQYWSLTIAASFARANVYKEKKSTSEIEKQKIKFKKELFEFIDDLVLNEYAVKAVAIDTHINNILEIQTKFTRSILTDEKLKFGVCQKLLNLYLKYLWCANYIDFEPPHFPLDRLIQEAAKIKKIENWTELDSAENYEKLINDICTDEQKAVWELKLYNDILKK